MPANRKSGRQSGGPTSKQSTLSFNHRVTKNVVKSTKGSVLLPIEKKPLEKEESGNVTSEDVDDITHSLEVEVDEPQPTKAVPEKSRAELAAEKVSSAAVERYWRKVEAERIAKRVHQDGITTGEKVLRYFDVSSQYGPCIGIPRVKRWQRAERLGLEPPVEVLAVLLKEEAKAKGSSERAYIDDLMNSTAIGTA